VKQNLQEVGIEVEIESADVAGWNQKTSEWDYDLAFTYLYQYGDPALGTARNYLEDQIEKGSPWNNVEGYRNPELDAKWAEAAVTLGKEERQKLYTEIQQEIVEDAPVAWLLELEFPTLYDCKVQDLVTTAIGVNDGLRDTWIKQ